MCSQYEETVDHIVSGCEVLAKTEYISRHDKAAAYLHWNICQDHDIEVIDKWYEHKPESVTHNKDSKITIMWDMPVNTDRTITANRPDIIIKDSVNSTGKPIAHFRVVWRVELVLNLAHHNEARCALGKYGVRGCGFLQV